MRPLHYTTVESLKQGVWQFARSFERHNERLDENIGLVIQVREMILAQSYEIIFHYTIELARSRDKDDKRASIKEAVSINITDDQLEPIVDSVMERLTLTKVAS